MTIIGKDGFDGYNGTGTGTGLQSKWTVGSTSPFSLISGRFGGQALSIDKSGAGSLGYAASSLSSAVSTGSFGTALRMTSMPSSDAATLQPMALFSGSTGMIGLRVTSTGAIAACRNTASALSAGLSTGTILGTSAGSLILLNAWNFIEVEFVISDTVGVFNVYLNGSSILPLSSQDTRNGSPTTVDTFVTGVTNGTTSNYSCDIDDLYVSDSATRLGERRIRSGYATADVLQGFARSTGSANYSLINEAQADGDTSYVQSATPGDVDRYSFGSFGSPATIDAVTVSAFPKKINASTRNIALQVKSGGTISDGPSYSLSTSYTKIERRIETDPNTGSAWTYSALNSINSGPKVV